MSREVVILSAARTPVGRYLGTLAEIPASQLGAIAMVEALKRAGVEPTEVEEVIMGNVLQAGQGQNPARKASLIAGIPQDVHAWTLNMVCASGAKVAARGRQHHQSRRGRSRGRRWHGEHEPGSVPDAPKPAPGTAWATASSRTR